VSLPYDRARARDYHPAGRDNPAPGHQGHRDAYRAEVVFEEQRSKGIGVWREPFSKMRVPKLYNLRSDPFEAGDDAILYDQWTVDHVFIQVPIQGLVAKWLETFRDFPPRAKPASFSVDQIIERFMPKAG